MNKAKCRTKNLLSNGRCKECLYDLRLFQGDLSEIMVIEPIKKSAEENKEDLLKDGKHWQCEFCTTINLLDMNDEKSSKCKSCL
jgi:hypothetical protein